MMPDTSLSVVLLYGQLITESPFTNMTNTNFNSSTDK